MKKAFSRTQRLLGSEAMTRLSYCHILLFGVGGVGSFAAEALVRSGLGSITLVDDDVVCESNLNRQIHATVDTIGQSKVQVMKKRLLAINPDCNVTAISHFYLPGDGEKLITQKYDYIIDAIDTVSAKIDIILTAQMLDIPVLSCMGTGNKLHPDLLKIADIFDTSVCPLCRVMRSELRKRGVTHLKVVYSPEPPICPKKDESGTDESLQGDKPRRSVPGSTAFVPPAAGLLAASEAVLDLIHQ